MLTASEELTGDRELEKASFLGLLIRSCLLGELDATPVEFTFLGVTGVFEGEVFLTGEVLLTEGETELGLVFNKAGLFLVESFSGLVEVFFPFLMVRSHNLWLYTEGL